MSLCQRWQMFKPQLNNTANELFDKCFKIQRSCKNDKYQLNNTANKMFDKCFKIQSIKIM